MITIESIYQGRRDASAKELEIRLERIYREHPSLEELIQKIAQKNLELAKETLFGTEDKKKIKELELYELQREKAKYLNAAHLSEADLQPRYHCNFCKDRGYLEEAVNQKCSCALQIQEQIRFGQAHLNQRIQKENFENFKLALFDNVTKRPLSEDETVFRTERENILEIKERAKEFIRNFDNPNEKSLFFYGGAGLGKSFMCSAIAKELVDKGKSVLYLTMNELVDMMQLYHFNRDIFMERYTMDDYFSVDRAQLLVLDDLGTELTNNFVKTVLFNVINSRMVNARKTIVSSNLPPDQLQELYGERISTRLEEYMDFFQFFGENKRWLL